MAADPPGHIHCDDCNAVEGEANRGDFETCPHGNDDHCADGSACAPCCIMADIACRY